MKIVVISDTHNRHRQLIIPEGDVLIHAGDISNWGVSKHIIDFNAWLATLPHQYKLVISGNHDTCLQGKRTPSSITWARKLLSNANYLQDEEITIDGIKFYGTPWTPWYGDWAFTLKKESDRSLKWNKIPKNTDVLITHGPPYSFRDNCSPPENSKERHVGCNALRKTIERIKPRLNVFGHVHIGYGISHNKHTKFINASVCSHEFDTVKKPFIIEI